MALIKTKGFELLTDQEEKYSQKLINEYSKRIEKKFKKISSFIIHLKEYKKEGSRKKFSIHIKISSPAKIIEANATNWDFRRTMHKAFNKIEQEIEHKFHISNQHNK